MRIDRPWVLMWAVAFALYFGFKGLTWLRAPQRHGGGWLRSFGYLLAWPGMDARSFLDDRRTVPVPPGTAWRGAAFKMGLGIVLLWGLTPRIPGAFPFLRGWAGLVGGSLLIHFGIFHLLALAWQSAGVDAAPIFRAPLLSASVGEFWSVRWNLAFHHLAREYVYSPLRRRIGAGPALLTGFAASGLIHELVISFPAGGGYGLPFGYFMLQGFAVLLERSSLGSAIGLDSGPGGRLFTIGMTGLPALALFHPPFITRVFLPFLDAIGAA